MEDIAVKPSSEMIDSGFGEPIRLVTHNGGNAEEIEAGHKKAENYKINR